MLIKTSLAAVAYEAGYTVQALITLGGTASKALPTNFLGTTTVLAADVINVVASIAGIFLWLLAFWFFCLASLSIIQGSKKMSFNLSWWAFIFPNAGLTLATIQIGKALNSSGILWVTSAMTVMLFVGWLVIGVLNIRAIWQGQFL